MRNPDNSISHHHEGNLVSDVTQLFTRRKLLALTATSALVAACDGLPGMGSAEANTIGKRADGSTCIKIPAETAGPFPADGSNRLDGATVNLLEKVGMIRRDIRGSFDGLTATAEGVNIELELTLVNVSNTCAALANHVVYIWHCDAKGRYSIYETTDSNYLRGAVLTDANGVARFTSIFPGCYAGRWPHIHFEIFESSEKATSGAESLLTSQLAFAQPDCEKVYRSHPAYAESSGNLASLSLKRDGIFGNNSAEQLAAQTLVVTGEPTAGLKGNCTIGVTLASEP